MTTAWRSRQRSRRIVTVSIFSRLTRGQWSFFWFSRVIARPCKCGDGLTVDPGDGSRDQPDLPWRRRAAAAASTPGEADVWVSREQFLALLDSRHDRADVRITFDDGNASDVEPRPAGAARARPEGDVLRRRRPPRHARVPRRRRRQGARGRRDDDRLPRHAPSRVARPRRRRAATRSSSTPRRSSRTSSAARSRRPRARSAPTTAGSCAGCGGRATPTSTRATAARPARASSCRPATASARTTSRPCSSRSSGSRRRLPRPAATREAGGEAVAVTSRDGPPSPCARSPRPTSRASRSSCTPTSTSACRPTRGRARSTCPGRSSGPTPASCSSTATTVVGAHLAFYSERTIDGRSERFCNLGAWCVLPDHRFHALRLLKALLAQDGYHFTDLSPSGNVVGVNQRSASSSSTRRPRSCPNLPWPSRPGGTRSAPTPRSSSAR